MTVQLEDTNGNPSTSSSAQTINLSTTSTAGAFYATQLSTTPITSVVIPAGESSVSFYYSDTKAGASNLTASDSALGSAPTQVETINPGVATNLVVKRPPSGIVAGIRFGLEVDAMDALQQFRHILWRICDRGPGERLRRHADRNDHRHAPSAEWPISPISSAIQAAPSRSAPAATPAAPTCLRRRRARSPSAPRRPITSW